MHLFFYKQIDNYVVKCKQTTYCFGLNWLFLLWTAVNIKTCIHVILFGETRSLRMTQPVLYLNVLVEIIHYIRTIYWMCLWHWFTHHSMFNLFDCWSINCENIVVNPFVMVKCRDVGCPSFHLLITVTLPTSSRPFVFTEAVMYSVTLTLILSNHLGRWSNTIS